MEKYSRYYGIIFFVLIMALVSFSCYNWISQTYNEYKNVVAEAEKTQQQLTDKENAKRRVETVLAQMKEASKNAQKEIFSPTDSDLGNDTLFFQLYSDLLGMLHSNSVKIKSMEHVYNPTDDPFVRAGNGIYFVCDINMEIVSNFVNLGKLVQDIVQYPYYMKINSLEIKPYEKDKKILLSKISLRLYSRTEPKEPISED